MSLTIVCVEMKSVLMVVLLSEEPFKGAGWLKYSSMNEVHSHIIWIYLLAF